MSGDELRSALGSVALLAGLDDDERLAIASLCRTLRIDRGEPLIREGERSTSLYLVLTGRFSVSRKDRVGPITQLGPGEPIGEVAFLTGEPRTATVTALRDSLVAEIDEARFESIGQKHPRLWPTLCRTLAERLAETTALASPVKRRPRPRTIALISAGAGRVDPTFAAALEEALASRCRLRVITSAADTGTDIPVRQSAGLDHPRTADIDQAAVTSALSAIEADYEVVLLVADGGDPPWSETAIRHADLAVAVANFEDDPGLGPIETIARRYLDPDMLRLVLLHPTRRRLLGTARWLRHRNLAMHHHVALDNPEDTARLARFLLGTARGFVACGGGALCAAHIGVFEAHLERGIHFDIMGGTSAGSAMVAGFILGASPDEMDRALHDMFVVRRAMSRYTLPRYSILDHTNFDRQLAAFFGGLDIEDLWLPYFAVASNLSRNSRCILRSGSLFSAIRASASIPALLPPIYTESGEMLVDGCLLDNVPIETMHALKGGPNAVVSFSVPNLQRYDVDYAMLPSRGVLARAIVDPWARRRLPPAPSAISVLMRSLMAARQDFQRHLGPEDRLIVPELPRDANYLDWHRHTELRRLGYKAAADALDETKSGISPP